VIEGGPKPQTIAGKPLGPRLGATVPVDQKV